MNLCGNMVYKSEHGAETLYIYDDRDFLKEAHLPNGDKIFIETGPAGRRLKRKFYDASAQTWQTIYYSYSGIQGIADYDDDWNLEAYYIPGLGIDRIEIMRKNDMDYYFVRDHLGSVRLVLDSDCNIVEEYEYSTYGELTIKNEYGQTVTESAIGNRHTYTGREWDDALGLYYYRARWYDPQIRRFTQKDIIHFTNRYIYVSNNPVNFVDPFGLYNIWNPATWGDPNSGNDTFLDSINPFGRFGLGHIFNDTFISTNGTTARIGSGIWNWDWRDEEGVSLMGQMDEVDPCQRTYGRSVINGAIIMSSVAAIYSGGAILGILPNPFIGGFEIHAAHLGGPYQFAHIQVWLRWSSLVYRKRIPEFIIGIVGKKFKLW